MVTDQIHDALNRAYEPGEIIAVGLIVDFYVRLCNYVASIKLPLNGREFVGWTPDDATIERLFGRPVRLSGNSTGQLRSKLRFYL